MGPDKGRRMAYNNIERLEFLKLKEKAIDCLLHGAVAHFERKKADTKNDLLSDKVNTEFVIKLFEVAKLEQYEKRVHYNDPRLIIHVLKPVFEGTIWYLKFFIVDPDIIFISVHKSEYP